MFAPLQYLFPSVPQVRRRKIVPQHPLSVDTLDAHELEPRRLLAVAPLPAVKVAAPHSPAAYVSAISYKADAPSNLAVSPKDQGAILCWSAPTNTGGSAINNYVVQYSIANSYNWKTIRTGNTMTSATLSGLANGTAYVFRVAAVTSRGTGGFTSPSAPITPPGYAVAPRAPVGLSAQASDGLAVLNWGKPSWDGGATITSYLIQYRSGRSLNWTTVGSGTGSATTATVTGLDNGTSYSFRVAAVNQRGAGDFSSMAVATPATVPDAASALVALPSNGTVVLSWTAPPFDGGRPVTDYQVLASSDGGLNWSPVQRATSINTQAVVRGLQNGSAYSFKVAAVNQMGVGSFSNPIGPVTPAATVPAGVTQVTSVIGDASMTVRWTVPVDDGGSAVTGYAIQYSADAGSTWIQAGTATATDRSFVVTRLTNGVVYLFRVAAVNDVGRGTFSAPTLPLAPATVPGQPGSISAVGGTGMALLSWVAPATDGGSPVTDYAIQYSTDGGASWTLCPHTPSAATSITVGRLANGIEHVFRVAAVNVMGAGDYSSVSTVVIPFAPVTIPGAPTSVTIQAGVGQATLTWSDPTFNGNSVITSYEISYSSDNKQTWSAPLSVPATSPTAVVANLSNGITYLVRMVAVNAAGRGSATIVSATPTNPAAQATVRFLKAGTLPVTVQFGYTVRDANGNRQAKFQTVNIGSLDRSGSITVPDFDRVDGSVTVTVTVRNLPRGITKTQSFNLVKKTNYSMGISYNTRDSDPWSATTIRCG